MNAINEAYRIAYQCVLLNKLCSTFSNSLQVFSAVLHSKKLTFQLVRSNLGHHSLPRAEQGTGQWTDERTDGPESNQLSSEPMSALIQNHLTISRLNSNGTLCARFLRLTLRLRSPRAFRNVCEILLNKWIRRTGSSSDLASSIQQLPSLRKNVWYKVSTTWNCLIC